MRIAIYQIMPELDEHHRMFRELESVQGQMDGHFPAETYQCVYRGVVEANTLEDVYTIFNIHHPSGYKGRSLSVSDVVEVTDPCGDSQFYYCDTFGFKRVTFAKEKTFGRVCDE